MSPMTPREPCRPYELLTFTDLALNFLWLSSLCPSSAPFLCPLPLPPSSASRLPVPSLCPASALPPFSAWKLGMGKFSCVIDWKTNRLKLECFPRKLLVGRILDIKEAMEIAMKYYSSMFNIDTEQDTSWG